MTSRMRSWGLLWLVGLVCLVGLAAGSWSLRSALANGTSTMLVDSTDDTDSRDDYLTLREALLLATGLLNDGDLTANEKDNLTGTPGPGSSDTIQFNAGVFPATINLGSPLPELNTGNDTVDGSTTGATVNGYGQDFFASCFRVNSNANVIQGLEIRNCWAGIWVTGGAQNNTIGQGNVIVNNFNGILITDPGTSGNQLTGNDIGFIDGAPPSPDPNSYGIFIGSGAGGNTIGGTTSADRNVIAGNSDSGIALYSSDNTITGNYIGTGPGGTGAMGNSTGVSLGDDAQHNVIGGSGPGERNVISGNGWSGVNITGSSARGNRVIGNYIGTNAAGTDGLGGQAGVQIGSGAQDNVIGGSSVGEANLISGNGQEGVRIQDSGTSYNRVIGNRIGTNEAGTGAIPNNNHGVSIWFGAWANSVGGWGPGEGNLISGNSQDGVNIWNQGTTHNRVINNYIGTNFDGSAPLPNAQNGVGIGSQAQYNSVAGNLISGNAAQGVSIGNPGDSGTSRNTLTENLIGTNAGGDAPLGNGNAGVNIWNADNNGIREGNVISGNGGHGVQISGPDSYENLMVGTFIGITADGTAALPNGGAGVSVDQGAHDNSIGTGKAGGPPNVISGNSNAGVTINGAGTNGNRVDNNFIGTNPDASGPMPNNNNGVDIRDGAYNNAIDSNIISGNANWGVSIQGGGTTGNQLTNNNIGTGWWGGDPVPNDVGVVIYSGAQDNTVGPGNLISFNTGGGVGFAVGGTSGNSVIGNMITMNDVDGVGAVYGCNGNTIGGPNPGDGNVISGNAGPGILITDDSSGFVVMGNFIGTDQSGTGAWSNDGQGVLLERGAHQNTIGGPNPGEGNVIAFNNGDGVTNDAEYGNTYANTIRGNSIHSHYNTDLGIENINGGNWEIPPPTILGQNPVTGTTCPNCTVDIYTDYEDEGMYYEGSAVAGIGGNFTFSGSLFGPWLTATTTDAHGNTSEFTAPIPVMDTGDDDMDGVPNYLDICPTVAEDIDDYQDGDGCPDPNNDGDPFPDSTDQCPGTDGTVGDDGIPCTDDANEINTCEDFDGVLDTDGCHDSPGDDYDGDLLTDEDEVFTYNTDAANPDSDGDGLSDGEEVLTYGTCPADSADIVALPQCDGVADARDTDGGGVPDGEEVARGTNPLDPADDVALCVFSNDADCDACWDSAEPGLSPPANPADEWDWYDVPVPTLFSGGHISGDPSGLDDRDHAVTIVGDLLAVLEYSGTADGGLPNAAGRQYNQDINGDGVDDGEAYDRSTGATRSGPPNGSVTIVEDVLLVLAQAGQTCQAPP